MRKTMGIKSQYVNIAKWASDNDIESKRELEMKEKVTKNEFPLSKIHKKNN